MKILEDKNNKLLARNEIKVVAEAAKNPSMAEASKLIAEHFKSNEDSVAVKSVKGKFGRNTFLISANVYKSKEHKDATEPKLKAKRGEQPAELR